MHILNIVSFYYVLNSCRLSSLILSFLFLWLGNFQCPVLHATNFFFYTVEYTSETLFNSTVQLLYFSTLQFVFVNLLILFIHCFSNFV